MEQVNLLKKPEITLPSGWASMYGGWSGHQNHYYSMRPKLWSKDVGISVKKHELNVTEPDQQGADPNETFKKTTYKASSVNMLKNVRFKDALKDPDGLPVL
jgi:hypothetical protein